MERVDAGRLKAPRGRRSELRWDEGSVEVLRPCDGVEIGRAEVEMAADDKREGRARLDARKMLMLVVVDVEPASAGV